MKSLSIYQNNSSCVACHVLKKCVGIRTLYFMNDILKDSLTAVTGYEMISN